MDDTVRGPAVAPPTIRPTSVASVRPEPSHAIATPRPTLLFAIAADDVDEVRRVLESGEAGPNDDVGPQSALAFALTADQLKHKVEIVKLLLAHGANPAVAASEMSGRTSRASGVQKDAGSGRMTPTEDVMADMDPATR